MLFFDTFELAYRRRVGRWFLDQLLPNSEGYLIVFAGRPPGKPPQPDDPWPHPELPPNVRFFKLQPWTTAEAIEYFRARQWNIPDDEVAILRDVTAGYPLLMDMVIYLRNSGLLDIEDLLAIPAAKDTAAMKQRTERALVGGLVRSSSAEGQALLEMAYLKRRFDPDIFVARQHGMDSLYADLSDYQALVSLLLDDPDSRPGLRSIVKYREQGQVLTLHDEAQRMIEEHAPDCDRPLWKDTCGELYTQIVQGWYTDAITQEQSEAKRALLKAEQLGYELEYDLERGLQLYQQYLEDARKNLRFDFNELIWGEVADKLEQGRLTERAYELCYTQADWLWVVSQFDSSADLYRLIIEKYTPDPKHAIRKLEALASLGHAMMNLGKYEKASQAFDAGLALAGDIQDIIGKLLD